MRHLLADAADQMLAGVLADDVSISPDLPAVLQAIEACGKSFDFIDLHRKFKRNEIFARCHGLLPGYALGRSAIRTWAHLGYVVSRQGAETFLMRTRTVHIQRSRQIAASLLGERIGHLQGWSARSSPLTQVIPSSIDQTRERRDGLRRMGVRCTGRWRVD